MQNSGGLCYTSNTHKYIGQSPLYWPLWPYLFTHYHTCTHLHSFVCINCRHYIHCTHSLHSFNELIFCIHSSNSLSAFIHGIHCMYLLYPSIFTCIFHWPASIHSIHSMQSFMAFIACTASIHFHWHCSLAILTFIHQYTFVRFRSWITTFVPILTLGR